MYQVYARLHEGKIIEVNSSEFLTDLEGWVRIDEGDGDKYHHAQVHYFEDGMWTEDIIALYKVVGGKAVKRSVREIKNERIERPLPEEVLSLEQEVIQLKAQIAEITLMKLEIAGLKAKTKDLPIIEEPIEIPVKGKG